MKLERKLDPVDILDYIKEEPDLKKYPNWTEAVKRERKKILDFYAAIEPGDEVWWYDDILVLSGTAGYAIVRSGEIIKQFVVWRS